MEEYKRVTIPSLDALLKPLFSDERQRRQMVSTVKKITQKEKVFSDGLRSEIADVSPPLVLSLRLHHFSVIERHFEVSFSTSTELAVGTHDPDYEKYQAYLKTYLWALENFVNDLAEREKARPAREPVEIDFVEQLAHYIVLHAQNLVDEQLRIRYFQLTCKLAKIGIPTYKGVINECKKLSRENLLSTSVLSELLTAVYNSQQTQEWHRPLHESWKRVLFWGILHSLDHKKGAQGMDVTNLMFNTLVRLSQLSPFGLAQFNYALVKISSLDTRLQELIGALGDGVAITDKKSVQVEASIDPTYIGITLHQDTNPPQGGSSSEDTLEAFKREYPKCEVSYIKTDFIGV